jgi:hypothetical protein
VKVAADERPARGHLEAVALAEQPFSSCVCRGRVQGGRLERAGPPNLGRGAECTRWRGCVSGGHVDKYWTLASTGLAIRRGLDFLNFAERVRRFSVVGPIALGRAPARSMHCRRHWRHPRCVHSACAALRKRGPSCPFRPPPARPQHPRGYGDREGQEDEAQGAHGVSPEKGGRRLVCAAKFRC